MSIKNNKNKIEPIPGILEITPSDTISEFMEKCNDNFYTISINGGGPTGKEGIQGSQGVPTKPKVPIHVWNDVYYEEKEIEIENDINKDIISESKDKKDKKYEIINYGDEFTKSKYQVGHLIVLKNAHVYKLVIDEKNELKPLKPEFIFALQSYDPSSVIDGKSAYIHIAFANSQNGEDFILPSKKLNSEETSEYEKTEYIDRKYMGIYSDYNEESSGKYQSYTWVKIVGNTGEKGDKGDTPIQKSVKAIGYSLTDSELNNNREWKNSISELGTLEPCTNIYIKNEYTWSDGSGDESKTYGKTVTVTGTKGDTGRVLFYLGSFKDGTLTGNDVKGYLNKYRCDYYIDESGQAWMRTGTKEEASCSSTGNNSNDDWEQSEKIGFLQDGAISANMLNKNSFSKEIFDVLNSAEINAGNIKTGRISSNDENSYFDLDTGDFVLGNNNGSALSYIGGKLHIGGLAEIEQAQKKFQNSLNNINSDEYFSIAEKKIIRTDWETISGDVKTTGTNKDYSSLNGNYGEAYRAAESSSIATTDIDTAFVSLRDYLNTHKLYENTDTSWGSTGRKTLAEKFTAYYNAEFALWSAINNAYADLKAFDDTAYSYLKKALANDTDIEGGLIATSQIQLRDWDDTTKKYKVNAGISGIEDDNVLLWGGGTYDEAVNAASSNNDFYVGENKSGRQITSLLKKDGQGKIGIFKISDTQAVVKTNQGEIIIDASDDNCGVYVKDEYSKIKTAIVGGEIEDYAPLDDEVIVSKSANIKSDTYNNGVFAEGAGTYTCTTSLLAKFNLKEHIKVSSPCYCKISVKVYGRLTQSFSNTSIENINNHATMQFTINGENKSPLSDSIYQNNSGHAQNGISPGQYYMEISRPVQNTSAPMATYNGNGIYLTPNSDFEVKLEVTTLSSGAGLCLAKLTGDLTFVIEVTRLSSYDYEPKTIIATDGIMTAYDNNNYFMIKNTSEGQRIYAKGLNKTKGEDGSGELYVSNTSNAGLLKTLKDAFQKISSVLSIAKYDGNDAKTQKEATDAITAVIEQLDKISIIANS